MGGYSQQQIYSTLSDYAREQVDLEYGGMSAIAPAEYQKGLNDPANGILYAVAVWSYSRPGKLDFIPIDVFYSVVSDRGSNRDWRRVPKATGIDPNRALTMRSDHAGPFKPYGVDARFTRRAPDRVQMNVNTGYGSVRSNSRGDTRVQVPGVGGVTVNQRGVPTRIDIKTRKGSRHR